MVFHQLTNRLIMLTYLDPEDQRFVALPPVDDARWVQVDCSLFGQAPPQPLYFPWVAWQRALTQWRSDGIVTQFFFVRKPPGLRLRFFSPAATTLLMPLLTDCLLQAEEKNDIRGFRFGIYEPETYRFGGKSGLAVAHLLFDIDTQVLMHYEEGGESMQVCLPRPLLSLIHSHDLISKCVDDTAEMWDVWKQAEFILNEVGATEQPNAPGYSWESICADVAYEQTLTKPALQLIQFIRSGNTQVASCIRATRLSGDLSIGVRAWLVAVLVFHWNRLGLTTVETMPMVASMIRNLGNE